MSSLEYAKPWKYATSRFPYFFQKFYIFKTFLQDLHGVDLEEFKYGGTNITAFRLVDPEGPQVRKIVRDWTFSLADSRNKKGEHTVLVGVGRYVCNTITIRMSFLNFPINVDIKVNSCNLILVSNFKGHKILLFVLLFIHLQTIYLFIFSYFSRRAIQYDKYVLHFLNFSKMSSITLLLFTLLFGFKG